MILRRVVVLVAMIGSGCGDRGDRRDRPQPPLPVLAVAKPHVAPVLLPPAIVPKRVVIISEDGMRPDVLTEQVAPRHVALMKEGAVAHHAETIPESDTLPSHASMLSGVGAQAHGLWWNSYQEQRGYIHVPTIFSAAHDAHLSTAMIVGKPKLRHIAAPGTVDHYERPSYLCGGVAKRAAEYFAQAKPDLLFVHFSDPDEYGHSHGWMSKEYMRAVHNSDGCLATVLAAIDASPDAATTLVIVTADHGGHGTRHSDGHATVDRDIPWIVRGPGIPRGVTLEEPIETEDTAATTLAALGLPALPNMIGKTARSRVRARPLCLAPCVRATHLPRSWPFRDTELATTSVVLVDVHKNERFTRAGWLADGAS